MLNGVWVLGFTSIIGSLTHLKIDMGLLGTQLLTPVTGLFCESPKVSSQQGTLEVVPSLCRELAPGLLMGGGFV